MLEYEILPQNYNKTCNSQASGGEASGGDIGGGGGGVGVGGGEGCGKTMVKYPVARGQEETILTNVPQSGGQGETQTQQLYSDIL